MGAVTPALAAFVAAFAVWWALPGSSEGLARLTVTPAERRAVAVRWPVWCGLGWAGSVVGAAVVAGPGAASLVLAAGQGIVCGVILSRRRYRRRAQARAQRAVVHAGELVAGLLRVGRVPTAALVEASADAPVLRIAAAELRAGGEASAALRRTATEPGFEGLLDLASAWEVSVRTGASLVGAVDAAAARLAAEADVARVVDAELAAARLGGGVMGFLPLVGLGLAFGVGGDPLSFLLGSVAGWVCLNVGIALMCGGVVWIDSVAERSGGR